MMKKILVLLLLAAPIILSSANSTVSGKDTKEESAKGSQEYVMGVDVKEFEKEYAKVHGNELKKMEEDGNPADFVLDDGKAMFHKVDGSKGKSCASCHGENGAKLKGIAISYPKYDASVDGGKGGILTIPMQINICREKDMGAKPWAYGKNEIVAVELFVKSLSNNMPIKVKTDGPASKFYEAGKKNFYTRLGEWNWNCAQCHVKYAGRYSRQELLPPAPLLGDHWPSYRLDWANTNTIQERFKGCIKNMRPKEIPEFETEFMRDLELYVTAQANGRLQHVPGFRR